MKPLIKIVACATFLLFCTWFSVSAIPAYPFPFKIAQPNGDSIMIQLHGDEFFHYVTTEDNYVIVQDNEGYYNYAVISDNETLESSKIKVTSSALKAVSTNLIKANSNEFRERIQEPAFKKVMAKRMEDKIEISKPNSLRSSSDVQGKMKGLVILANFQDVRFTVRNTRVSFSNMLNETGYVQEGGTGSARDFYISNSNGIFTPDFQVYGPVGLPHEMAYYGKDDGTVIDPNGPQMIIDACNAAKQAYPDLDFSEYDYDKDGIIDFVFIFYAGYNQAEGGGSNSIWSHKYSLYNKNNPAIIDGDTLSVYACTSELKLVKGVDTGIGIAGIGTFVHEFSHILGLPDLYDTDGSLNGLGVAAGTGVGYWCTMGYGGYLNDGRTPPYYGAMERLLLGWTDLRILKPNEHDTQITIPPIGSSNIVYMIETPTPNEFFTFEARKKENRLLNNWDRYLPEEGMLAYHIDYTSTPDKNIIYNNNAYTVSARDLWNIGYTNVIGNHQCMDLLRANNISLNDTLNSRGHPYPGQKNITSINDRTVPGFISWAGANSGIEISNISRNTQTGEITFNIKKTSSSGIDELDNNKPVVTTENDYILYTNVPISSTIEIFDISGKKFLNHVISGSGSIFIPYSGIYIAKVKSGNKEFSYKILIK